MGSDARADGSSEPGLEPGRQATIEAVVTEDMTAAHVGSGDVPFLATPAVLALVERAAVAALAGRFPSGLTTVGASVELSHLAPTPVGAQVRAAARLERVEGGRRLTFSFSVTDDAGPVAEGNHVRVLVDRERFEAGARARAMGQAR